MNRYPSAGKGSKWTTLELKSIPTAWKGDTLNDSGGLSGDVRVNASGEVTVSFRYAMKVNGEKSVKWFYCGIYPNVSMAKIREARDEARELLKKGLDPRQNKVSTKIKMREEVEATMAREEKRKAESLTVQDMFDVWIADGVKRKDGNKYIIQTFNKYIIPNIGNLQVKDLEEKHLSKIYKQTVADGKNATALELSKDVKQMMKWCEKRKPWRSLMVEGNPSDLVEINKILPSDFTKIRDRVLSVDELKRLKVAFDSTAQKYNEAENKYGIERPLKQEVQIAMWICLSTLCRIGELMMTEWKHVDFKNRIWFIPAANTKKVGRFKQTDHTVYLSDFALSQFEALKELTGDTEWAFPARYKEGHVSVKSASKQIGDRQIKFKNRTKKLQYRVENNTLVVGDDEWTPHDLRTTGATMIQELFGIPQGMLLSDLCLHHKVVTGSARHYMFAEYADEMRKAWQRLGDRLEAILNSDNVVSLKRA